MLVASGLHHLLPDPLWGTVHEDGAVDLPTLRSLGRPITIYFVRRDGAVWRIVHEGHRAGAYVTAEAALAYARRLARESAALGYPTAVVKTGPSAVAEGFMPRGGAGR